MLLKRLRCNPALVFAASVTPNKAGPLPLLDGWSLGGAIGLAPTCKRGAGCVASSETPERWLTNSPLLGLYSQFCGIAQLERRSKLILLSDPSTPAPIALAPVHAPAFVLGLFRAVHVCVLSSGSGLVCLHACRPVRRVRTLTNARLLASSATMCLPFRSGCGSCGGAAVYPDGTGTRWTPFHLPAALGIRSQQRSTQRREGASVYGARA